MIEHGHTWCDIKEYSLGEIGIFIREAQKREELEVKSQVISTWTGFNADQKYIRRLTNATPRPSSKQESQSPEKSRSEWMRLAAAMSGLKSKH